jgi:hypothetical protein
MECVTDVEVAWDLLDSHRGCLTVAERHAVSIDLAIGEYQSAIYNLLTAVVRENGALTAESAHRVDELMKVYECGPEFRELLEAAVKLRDARQQPAPAGCRPSQPWPVS